MPANQERKRGNHRTTMPFVSAAFAPGKGREYIESIEDPEEKALAWADYYQYSGIRYGENGRS